MGRGGEMRLVHISDLHGKHKKVLIPECDLLLCTGDISPLGEKHQVDAFLKWFNRQTQATFRVFIAGNHDRGFDRKFDEVTGADKWLPELFQKYKINNQQNCTYYLENQSIEIMGVKIWGSPYSAWYNGHKWAFNVHRGQDANDLWRGIPKGTDIVMTHGPVYGKLDFCENIKGYIGDEQLRYRIKEVKPLLFLCGHIHEAYGYDYDEDTHYFNGATCTLQYNPSNLPWVIEVDFEGREINIINHDTEGESSTNKTKGE
jgi:Icc-related predicted phosphoesterase